MALVRELFALEVDEAAATAAGGADEEPERLAEVRELRPR
jgi:hypothetical protein